MLRESWGIVKQPVRLLAHVTRLIVPNVEELSEPVKSELETREFRGATLSNVVIHFATDEDWLKCFPLGDAARVPYDDDLEDFVAWGAVAMCGNVMGLAVFTMENGDALRTNVQPVPQDKFEALRTS